MTRNRESYSFSNSSTNPPNRQVPSLPETANEIAQRSRNQCQLKFRRSRLISKLRLVSRSRFGSLDQYYVARLHFAVRVRRFSIVFGLMLMAVCARGEQTP